MTLKNDDVLWDDDIVWDNTQEPLVERGTAAVRRQAQLTARHTLEGLAGTAGIFSNPISAAWNLTAGNLGAPRINNNVSDAVGNFLDRAGFARPKTPVEQFVGAVSRPVAGGGGTIAAAQRVAGPIASLLSSGPAMQGISAATGGAAGEIARQAGAPEDWQLAASLGGAFAPSALTAGLGGTTRALMRGPGQGNADLYNLRRMEWERAGRDPTVGQASGKRIPQGMESGLSRAPGGAGVMVKSAEEGARAMRDKVDDIANNLSRNADPAAAGRAIQEGTRKFIDRFRLQQTALYNKVDVHIPPGTQVGVSNTKAALVELNADIQGAPELSKFFKNATIVQLEKALQSDAGKAGTIPYEALKKVRTLVGREIDDANLASTVARSKWKSLYGALSRDMEDISTAAGPQAQAAWQRANWFTRAGHDRIEGILNGVANKDTVESVFAAATSGAKDGPTTINAVYRSLLPEERSIVTAAVINRLGKATPGTQNQAGDIFSSETFLTNWNRISPQAKQMLFANATARRGLDDLALASERIRQGSKVFANPSGTQQALAQQGVTAGIAASLLTGRFGIAATILGGVAANYGTAKLMTSPRFVSWVGQTTRMSPARFPAALQALAQQSRNWPDDEQAAVQQFIGSVGQQ